MTTEVLYVALDAARFEERRFLDYPREITEQDVGRIRTESVRAGWGWVEEPVGYYLKLLPEDGDGARRIDGPEGWAFVVADMLASCEVDRWRADHAGRLLEVFTGMSFSSLFENAVTDEEWAAWRRLANTLAPRRNDPLWSSAPWWRVAMADDGTYTHGLISPAQRDQIVEEMVGTDLVSRFVGQLRDHGKGDDAEDLDHLVEWLSSDASGRWVFAFATSR